MNIQPKTIEKLAIVIVILWIISFVPNFFIDVLTLRKFSVDGFENYKHGTIGLEIGFFDEYYSPGSGLYTDIRIIEEELDGHCNYLTIRDNQSEDNTWAVHYIENPQSIGTIEFYNRFKGYPDGSPSKRHYL